ncbi:MAG: site-2 protease family protein [Candidatus Thermoplasmatota archaeon]|nr:site-2 protease family protein [Candidatus Thermoplasmatota archaeon]
MDDRFNEPRRPQGPTVDVGYASEPSGGELEHIRQMVARYFSVYEVKTTADAITLYVHVYPEMLDDNFELLRKDMWKDMYVPFLDMVGGEYIIKVMKSSPRDYRSRNLNAIFLAATIGTTSIAGMLLWSEYANSPEVFSLSNLMFGILFFSFPIMAIFGVHEMGHYFAAKRHGIAASLPFFIPLFPPIGTMGAFINIREPIPNKKALMDIGAAGPIAGFVVAIPVTLIGLWLTALDAHPIPQNIGDMGGVVSIQLPLLYTGLYSLFSIPPGVEMHPVAFAGWVGFFVTALNLLPMGQLDGGHIFRSMFGKKSHMVGYAAAIALVMLSFMYTGWIIIVFLVLFLGLRHPPPLNDITPLGTRQWAAGGITLFLLIACFAPVPLSPIESINQLSVEEGGSPIEIIYMNSTNSSSAQVQLVIYNTGNTYLEVVVDTATSRRTPIWEGWAVNVGYVGEISQLNRDQTPIIPLNSSENATITLEIIPPVHAQPGNETGLAIRIYGTKLDSMGDRRVVAQWDCKIIYEIIV